MARENIALLSFNRGLVSPLALARLDIKRLAFSAETMVNWMPRVLGSMMLRPGWQYIGATASNAAARFLPFIFATDDTALIELTNENMRIWIDDALVTRPSVTSTVTNGNFDTDLTGWTDNDEAGGTSVWVTGGYMGLTGNGTAAAVRDQTVTVAGANISVEHALNIVVQRGPVVCRVGTGTSDDSYIRETNLGTGTHSLAFTPTGNFNIRFLSRLKRQVLVSSCNIDASGVMSVTAPWLAADLGKIRVDQSADVVFLSCAGYQQRRIERRATRSWSVAVYEALDGPFMSPNIGPITMTPGALSGNTTLTASAAYFRSSNVGSLFRVTSSGQTVTASITAENQFTNPITIDGVGASQRTFTMVIDEVGVATFTLQRSLTSDAGPWTDVANWTADTTETLNDGFDNQIVYYRLGVKTGNFTSGTHAVSLGYSVGSADGVGRVTAFTSATVVDIEVITDFGAVTSSDDWAEGKWSDRRGWPTAVAFYEGRLWWAGKNGIQGSVSDAFDSYDIEFEGDAGPIIRDVGSGPVDIVNWLLPLSRLIAGAQGAEFSCKSSSLDEPLTPTAFSIKPDSTQGSAAVPGVKIDKSGVFVQRGGTRVFELSRGRDGVDYDATDMTVLIPEIGQPSIVRMAAQRQPDTRVHCVRSDGVAGVCVFDRAESVICWVEVETVDGDEIEDVVTLPGEDGDEEDRVYYVVKRTVNGGTVRYLEKWAMESECSGGATNKQADSFVTFTNAPASTTVSVPHLVGCDVVVWQDGVCPEDSDGLIKTYLVSGGGTITLDTAASVGMVGLPYTAQWKSTKLGTMLATKKAIRQLGVLLVNTHYQGLEYGPDFDTMDNLPLVERGAITAANTVHSEYEEEPFEFPGEWKADSRLCLQASAPRPCNILAAVIPLDVNPKS